MAQDVGAAKAAGVSGENRPGKTPAEFGPRLGSGREPFVPMMQAAELWECDNLASTRWAYGTRIGAVLCERQVGPGLMVIVEVG